VSQQFDETEQGAAQGALTSIQSLTSVVGPPVFTSVFGYFTGPAPVKIPGAPFYLGAAFTVVAVLMAKWALSHRPDPKGTGNEALQPDA
jgi:DHA1 family tetracycline resistance protein-like MFS transporter